MVAWRRKGRRPFTPVPVPLMSRTLEPADETAPVPAPSGLPERQPGPAPRAAAPLDRGRDWLRRHQVGLAWGVGLFVLFFAISVTLAFPSIRYWRTATPGDYGDAVFSQWLLRWNVHGVFDGSDSVFSPNIYWPHRNTLVYSDSTLGFTPVAAVAGFLFGWPLAYNVIYILGWVASMASAYALARWVGISRGGAVLAGIIFSFAPVRLGHYGHFPMLSAFLAPLSLLLLLRFLEERRWWQAVALGLAGGAAFLNAGYIAVVLFPTLAVVAAGWLLASRFRPGRRFFTGLALAGVLTAAMSWPILSRYQDNSDYLRREYDHSTAAIPRNFLSPADGNLLWDWMFRRSNSSFENRLFPGALAVALGTVGVVALGAAAVGRVRSQRPGDPRATAPDDDRAGPGVVEGLRRRGLWLVVLGGLPALVFSFGKYQTIAGNTVTLPFEWVSGLPGYQSIRAFGRFTVIPLMGLALLAAVGYDRLVRNRQTVAKAAVAVAFGAFLMVEYKVRVITAPRVNRPELTAVNTALARLPEGPVVELPMGDSREPNWAFVEAPRLFLSAGDWNPRVNGYSGYSPPDYERSIDLFNALDDGGPAPPETLAHIDELGVRYLVVRMTPPDRDYGGGVGVSYEDTMRAGRVVAALPPERVEGVSAEGASLLIRLRPPPATP